MKNESSRLNDIENAKYLDYNYNLNMTFERIKIKTSTLTEQKEKSVETLVNSKLFDDYFNSLAPSTLKNQVNETKKDYLIELTFQIISSLMTVSSIIVYILQTMNEEINFNTNFIRLELFFAFYFFCETVIIIIKYKSKKYIFSFNFIIDILVIFPPIFFYFSNISNVKSWSFFRTFRFMKMFRLYKILDFIKSIERNIKKEEVQFRHNPIIRQVIILITILICSLLIGAGFVLGIQSFVNNSFSIEMNFFDAVYFMVVLCTTIGYGDITPTNKVSRIFVTIMLFTVIITITKQFTKIIEVASLSAEIPKSINKKGHIIVFCNKTINLKSFLEEIRIRDKNQYVLIMAPDLTQLESRNYPFNKTMLMKYNISSSEFLRRSNLRYAKAIFIFANKSSNNSIIHDKFVDSLMLKIHQYHQKIPLYIQTLNSEKILNSLKYSTYSERKIPIFKLKSFIIAKSLSNPGFSTFIQNLMFNNSEVPSNIQKFSPVYKEYQLGALSKIEIYQLPEIFFGRNFFDVYRLIYYESINKIQASVHSRPVILIGVFISQYEKEKIIIFPNKFIIEKDNYGVFITHNENSCFLKNFFADFKICDEQYILEKIVRHNKLFISSTSNIDKFGRVMTTDRQMNKIEMLKKNLSEDFNLLEKKSRIRKSISVSNNPIRKSKLNEKIKKEIERTPKTELQENLLSKLEKRDQISKTEFTNGKKFLIEGRVISLNKDYQHNFKDHILIIGFQDNLFSIIKLIQINMEEKEIYIISNDLQKISEMKVILKYFENVYLLEGDPVSPKILVKAGIKDCFYTILLLNHNDELVDEDIKNIIIFKSIQYFFNTKVIFEIWNEESVSLLGNIPLDKNKKIMKNPFNFPNYISGKILYLNLLEKIVAQRFLNKTVSRVWIKLIELGDKHRISFDTNLHFLSSEYKEDYLYFNDENSFDDENPELEFKKSVSNLNLKRNVSSSPNSKKIREKLKNKEKDSFFVTLDIPEEYEKKEYMYLVHDLTRLDPPVIPIGIYLGNPLEYLGIREYMDDLELSPDNVQKEELINFLEYLKVLKKVSFNKKTNLDFEDFDHNSAPLFLTNPSPNFIILKDTKVLVISCSIQDQEGLNDQTEKKMYNNSRKSVIKNKNDLKECLKLKKYQAMNFKKKLNENYENFFDLHQSLKENYIKEYNKVMKRIDKT